MLGLICPCLLLPGRESGGFLRQMRRAEFLAQPLNRPLRCANWRQSVSSGYKILLTKQAKVLQRP